jgi:catechol 2,3-dioxygenase-like lactoylglutathione lyase family enzyme
MADRATANLPSRDLDKTAAFYQALGFEVRFKDGVWMILDRGPLELEFFPMPELDPTESWFSACFRVDDLDALYAEFLSARLSDNCRDVPRMTPPQTESFGLRLFALVDLDGSLIRCIDNRTTAPRSGAEST